MKRNQINHRAPISFAHKALALSLASLTLAASALAQPRYVVTDLGRLPGHAYCDETIRLPAVFQRGEVKIALGIVDQSDTPRVWWAIPGPTDGGWHPLTSINAT